MLPDPEEADEDGTPTLKHTSCESPEQSFNVAPLAVLAAVLCVHGKD